MTYSAVAVIGVLSICNLVLTMTVVRQVRRHGEQLASWRPGPGMPQAKDIPVGQQVPDFTVATLSGEQVSRGALAGERSLIAFFSVRCEPCKNHLPEFRDYASTAASGPARVLAVLVGSEDDAGDFIEGLAGVASIAVQPMRGPMVTAFSATAFPTFYQLDEQGRVVASGRTVRMLERAAGRGSVTAGLGEPSQLQCRVPGGTPRRLVACLSGKDFAPAPDGHWWNSGFSARCLSMAGMLCCRPSSE